MKNYDIEKLVSEINFNENFIGYHRNDIILTNKEIAILERCNIDYKNIASNTLLLNEIDALLDEEDDEELEEIASNIYERNYYLYMRK